MSKVFRMNTNPHAKRILCFGDSNTHGTIPYPFPEAKKDRYAINERWTGSLQNILGLEYEIIEEGRGGRTIATPGGDGTDVTKVGSFFLEGLLYTHQPLDLVIVMLGTNDIKDSFNLEPSQIATMMEEHIIKLVKNFDIPLLLLSPPSIQDGLKIGFPLGSHQKISELNNLYQKLAQQYNLHYINLQNQLICGPDGIHLTLDSHQVLSKQLAEKIKEIL